MLLLLLLLLSFLLSIIGVIYLLDTLIASLSIRYYLWPNKVISNKNKAQHTNDASLGTLSTFSTLNIFSNVEVGLPQ